MGVQILETFVGLSRLSQNEQPVVYVNAGGLSGGAASDQLTKIFDCSFEIFVNDETRKTPYWEPGCATEIFSSREHILNKFISLKQKTHERYSNVLHVRARDKASMTFHSYMKLAKNTQLPLTVCTDDTSLPFPREYNVSKQDSIFDWYSMLNADIIYCGPSTFPITTLLFNPNKKIRVASEKSCDGDFPNFHNDYVFIREAQKFCPNLEIIDVE
jgi:hypothetical protein